MIDISKIKKKTFDVNFFMDTYLVYEHKKVVGLLKELEDNNIIVPVKSSSLTVKYPQIHTKYRVCEVKREVNEDIIKEINFKLNNKIKIDYIRNNVDEYLKIRDKVLLLNNFLSKESNLSERISVNERSFEIFGDEKFLYSKDGKEFLRLLGLSIYDLNVYLTPEPFFYSSSKRESGQTVLITENKDTYITLLKILNEKGSLILGEKVDTVIYGEGKKIISSFNSIYEDANLDYLNSDDNKLLYWGDIDKEGFYIYGLLRKQFPSANIELFDKAYSKMLDKYNLKSTIKRKCSKEQAKGYNIGLKYLDGELKDKIKIILENGFYIPQEILSIKDLKG